MKIKFNELGAVIETITNDEPLRQGNIGANTLAAIFEGKINARYSATFNFTRSDGSKINNVVMSANIENIDEFDFTFKDAFFFALDGETTITVFLRDGAGNVIANGQIKFNIEKTDFDEDVPIDFDQYNQLLNEINGKTNKADFDNSALEINTLTYSQCKTLSTKVIYKAFDNGVPCLLINRGLTTAGYVLNVMMADATFNLKKITVPELGENIIENYTTYEESKPKIIDLTPYITFTTGFSGTITEEGYALIDLSKPNIYKVSQAILGDLYAICSIKSPNNVYEFTVTYDEETSITQSLMRIAITPDLRVIFSGFTVASKEYVDTKYTKPETGIPETDLSSDVQQKLNSGSNIIDITPYLTFTSPDEGTISNEGYGIILNNALNNKNILYFVGQQQSYLYFKVENLLSGDNINFTILLSSAMSQFLDFKILIYKEGEVNKFSMVSSASISVNDNYDGTISIFDRDTAQGGTAYTKEKVDELLLNKYTKPASGIPKTDLSSDVQTSLEKANTAVQPDDLLSYCLAVDAAHTLEMTIDSSTYILTAKLKNKAGEVLGTPQTVDLPLETMVVNGKYDADNKSIILTLKNGQSITFSVADLVSGLQTEITSENKLSADLVKDGSTNKVFTTDDKNSLQRMQTDLEYIGPIIDKVGKVIDLSPYIQLSASREGTISQEGYNLIDLTKPNVYKITHPELGDLYAIADMNVNNNEYQLNVIYYNKTNVDTIIVFNLTIYSNLNLILTACIVPLITYVDEKYTKPASGIPESDLDSSVQTKLNKPIEQIEATSLNDALATITNSIKGNNDYTSNGYRQKIYVFKNNSISESYYIFPLSYGINISRDFDQYFLVVEGVRMAHAEFNYYRCTIPISSSATADNVSKIGTLKDDFTNVVNKTSETAEDLPNRLKITIPIKYRASNLFDFEEDIFHKVYYDCLIIESTPLTLDFYNEIKDNNGTVRIVLNHPVKNRFKNIGIPSQISRKGKLGFYHTNNYEVVEDLENLQSILDNETIIVEPNDLAGKNGKWIIRKIIPLRDILNIVLPDIYKPISYGNTIPTAGMDRNDVGTMLSYRQQFDAISKKFVNLPFGSPLRHGWRRGVINRQIFYPINQLNTNEDIFVGGRFLIHRNKYAIRARLANAGQGGYLFSWNPKGTPDYSKKKPRWSFNRCAVGFSLCKLNHPTASEYAYKEPIFAKKYPLANKKLVLKSTPYVSPGFSVDYQTYCKTEINLKDNK